MSSVPSRLLQSNWLLHALQFKSLQIQAMLRLFSVHKPSNAFSAISWACFSKSAVAATQNALKLYPDTSQVPSVAILQEDGVVAGRDRYSFLSYVKGVLHQGDYPSFFGRQCLHMREALWLPQGYQATRGRHVKECWCHLQ